MNCVVDRLLKLYPRNLWQAQRCPERSYLTVDHHSHRPCQIFCCLVVKHIVQLAIRRSKGPYVGGICIQGSLETIVGNEIVDRPGCQPTLTVRRICGSNLADPTSTCIVGGCYCTQEL